MTRGSIAPPARAERLLERVVASSPYAEDIAGDLHESFNALAQRRSLTLARWWYRVQVFALVVRFMFRGRTRPRRKGQVMDRLLMEARFAVRSLLKRPGLTAAAAMTLALGLGANAAVFGIIGALVLHPYNMPAVERIVTVSETTPNKSDTRRETVSPANFLDWRRDLAGTVDHLTAMEWWDVNLVGRDEPERALGFRVSSGFFAAVGIEPVLGRGFRAEEETRGRDMVIVLSDGLWKRRFGADPAIVGKPILANGAQRTVVGIMPPGFDFPQGSELWSPLSFDPSAAPIRSDRYLSVVGRLHEGKSFEDASAQMAVEAARLARDFPTDNKDRSARVYPISRGMGDDGTERVLVLWQAAALFVLLIACANIANLLLARGSERGREIAVRLALGSSRGRVVRESLVESVLLAFVAVPLSLGVSWLFLTVIRSSMPARVMRFVAGWNSMRVDAPLVATTVGLAVVASVVFGLLPALQISRSSVSDALKSDGRGGAGPGRHRLRRTLVVAEIALVLPLLVAAILSVRSVTTLVTGWQGYDPEGVLMLKTALPEARYPDADSRRRFAADALERIGALPAVEHGAGRERAAVERRRFAGAISRSKGGRPSSVCSGRSCPTARSATSTSAACACRSCRDAAFRAPTSRRPLHVAVVSESMAKKFWPDGGAIGAQVAGQRSAVDDDCRHLRRGDPRLVRGQERPDPVPAAGAGAADRHDVRRSREGRSDGDRAGRPPRDRAGRRRPADLRRDADAAGDQGSDDRASVRRRRDGHLRRARARAGRARALCGDELSGRAAGARNRRAHRARRDHHRRDPARTRSGGEADGDRRRHRVRAGGGARACHGGRAARHRVDRFRHAGGDRAAARRHHARVQLPAGTPRRRRRSDGRTAHRVTLGGAITIRGCSTAARRGERATDYDAVAERYDVRYGRYSYAGVRDTVLSFLGDATAVLEVGCGTRALAGRNRGSAEAFALRRSRGRG